MLFIKYIIIKIYLPRVLLRKWICSFCSSNVYIPSCAERDTFYSDTEVTTTQHTLTHTHTYYFEVHQDNVNDYTYFHQFSANQYVFRPAASGTYSQQIKANGSTFITVECPCETDGELWAEPGKHADKVWQECIDMGLLKPATPRYLSVDFVKAPVTHRYEKSGYEKIAKGVERKIDALDGVIVVPSRSAFSRREIYLTVDDAVNIMAKGQEWQSFKS